jgi:histidine ammonia-lyase
MRSARGAKAMSMWCRGSRICVLVALVAGLLGAQAAPAAGYNPITPTQSDRTITLTGKGLTTEEVVAVARHGAKVRLSEGAERRSLDAYNLLLDGARQGLAIYWFNRAAGSGRETVIFEGDPLSPENEQLLLETQLGRFKSFPRDGVGPEVMDEEIVRAMMVVRANTMVYEAASPGLTEMLPAMLNNRVSPVVQSRGSPGEGDLPQMGNVGGAMVGAGQAYFRGQKMSAREALARAGIEPLVPFAADDAALTSTNAFTTGQAALLLEESKQLLDWSDLTFAMSMLGLNSSITPLTEPPQQIHPFPYDNWLSKRLLKLVRGSYLFDYETPNLDAGEEAPEEEGLGRIIQDPLSYRDYNHRNGSLWQAYSQLKRDVLIQINSSDHNPAVVPGSRPSDSWELNTPWLRRYYVEPSDRSRGGFILSNSNFVHLPVNNDIQAFSIALAEAMAGTAQRPLRLTDTFFTVVAAGDVLSPDILDSTPPQGSSYSISDLFAEIQQLANPVPAQGNALIRQVEDVEGFGRQKVARARLAVDNALRLVAEELLSASYWMEVRREQKPSRSFAVAPTAALTALRTVIPWQDDAPPELPTAELVHAFMLGTPAATFMGKHADDPRIRGATKRAARKAKQNQREAQAKRRHLKIHAGQPAKAARRP